jgi:hypothetical protein
LTGEEKSGIFYALETPRRTKEKLERVADLVVFTGEKE